MLKSYGYATNHSYSRLALTEIEREEAGALEVEIGVMFCGVCHSDVHQAENDWGNTVYPCMPGHEIVGRVVRAGADVTRYQVGDLVGVGCMIDSCRECPSCRAQQQQYCQGPNSWLATYNGPMKPKRMADDGTNHYGRDNTFGGYSDRIVVREDFVLRIPEAIAPAAAAPIMCAGVTTYSPLKHWGAGPGKRVGIVGFGGLGDIAVKIARAMGAEVTVLTTSEAKRAHAEKLGAACVVSTDKKAMAALESQFDLLLSTIPEKHKVDPFIPLLKIDAAYVAVGVIGEITGYNNQELIMGRRSLAGSVIGSIGETQEVLDLCAEHGIAPDIQVIPINEVNAAYKRVKAGDVSFRFVIDMASLQQEIAAA